MLALNAPGSPRRAEVVVMSRNSTETSLRIFNSIRHYGLDITRAALSGGAPLAPYLDAFKVDLFLSGYEDDVRRALDSSVAAALLYDRPSDPLEELGQIRIAFDGDAIIFSDESERIYQQQGLQAFAENERRAAGEPLNGGPFRRVLQAIHDIQAAYPMADNPIRTALVTATERLREVRTTIERTRRSRESCAVDSASASSIGIGRAAWVWWESAPKAPCCHR